MASEIESNNSIGTANILKDNVQITGLTGGNDSDFFKIYNYGAGTSKFTVIIPANITTYIIRIYDSSMDLQRNYEATVSAIYSIPSTSEGYSYISIFSYSKNNDYSITGNYIADTNAGTTNEIESNNSIGTANLLTANVTMTGQPSGPDIDYFKLYNSGSGISHFTINIPNNRSNYSIKIYDNSGTVQKSSYTTHNGSTTYSIPSVSAGYSYISVNSLSTDDYSITGYFIADNPSYKLSANLTSIDEGSTVSFTLITTNLDSGTLVPYTLSGISAADVSGGLLSGNAVVNSWGRTFITVSLLSDSLTEGPESLTVTAGGASASTVINDTSLSLAPEIYISSEPNSKIDAISINEGSNFYLNVFNLNINIPSYSWSISGISSSDILGQLTGTSNTNGGTEIGSAFLVIADNLTEGEETLTINIAGLTKSIKINDTSKSIVQSTYDLSSTNSSVNEGGFVRFSLVTTNVQSGTILTYTLSGVSSSDITNGILTGSITTVTNGNANYIDIPITADKLTEGIEHLTLSIAGKSASVSINDTSTTPVTTYSVVANSSNVNEGGSASFTITAIDYNTSSFYEYVPYTISGVGVQDLLINSLFDGVTLSATNPSRTISIPIYNDEKSEGFETITVTVGGKSASILINDTSKTLATPTYSLTTSSSFDEGTNATFTLITTNVAAGTSVPYTLSGVSESDVSNGSLNGTVVINSNGTGTISIGLANDLLQEGTENLTVSAGGASATTVINDTSSSTQYIDGVLYYLRPPSYSLSTYTLTSRNELVSFPSSQAIVSTDTYYGFQSGSDIIHLWRTDNLFGMGANYSPNTASFKSGAGFNSPTTQTEYIIYDTSTGRLYFDQDGTGPSPTVMVGTFGDKPSLKLSDFKMSQPQTYSLTPVSSSINEGNVGTFTLSTSNVPTGTVVPYTISGIGAADVSGGSLSGTVTVGSNGQASITVLLANDNLTEGTETLTVTAGGASASAQINDTSKSASPTYAVSANSSSVNEGSPAIFTISTTSVVAGSSIAYTLTGVSSSDITGGSLSGYATVNSSGTATVSVPIASDNMTEGTETLTISLEGKTASVVINDTSKAAAIPTYNLVAESASVNEGSVAAFNLITTNVAPGTTIIYTLSGVSASDVTGGLSGTTTVDANGLAAISVPLTADFLTEGNETLTVSSQGKSASVLVNDSSKSALIASYALSASSISVSEGSSAVFTLTTVNVLGGTSVTYTVTGVSASDIIGGALSGTAIVSASGNATISIPIAADLFTEGSETLTVTAQQVSSSVVISDSSITPNTVSPVSTEAPFIPYGSGRFFLQTSGPDKATGTPFIDVFKQTSNHDANQIVKLSDGHWQIQNKANPTNTDTLVNVERVNFNDVSLALDVSGPAGLVAKILGAVFGPAAVKNSSYAGIGLAYLDSGMSYQELAKLASDAAGLNSPDAVVSTLWKNVVGFTATQSDKAPYIKQLNDGMSIGELVTSAADSSLNAQSISFTDLSNTGLSFIPYSIPVVPTYSLSAQASVSEGGTASVYLSTTNVAAGTLLDYVISGISQSDLVGSLSGKVNVDAAGKAVINLITVADSTTEGLETMTISLGNATAQIVINDTSINKIATYDLSAQVIVNEGESANVYLSTTNVPAGTFLDYEISGISQSDLDASLSGKVSVDASGKAVINLLTVADSTTEGPETMTITLGNATARIVIYDTSITIVGIPIDTGGGGDGGGGAGSGD